MPRYPVNDFFPVEFCTPATLTGVVDGTVEIDLLYENDPTAQRVLNSEVVNGGPRAFVRVCDVASPRRGDTITLHPQLGEEATDDFLLTERGDLLLAEGQTVMKVHAVLPTEYGYNELTLSRD